MTKSLIATTTILSTFLISSAFLQNNNDLQKSIERGKDVYALYCRQCHGTQGTGKTGVYPPLANADYMKKPAKTLITFLLNVQNGEIIVNNVKYKALMPSQAYLTDEQIADVLNFTRNSWGNQIPVVITPAQVKALRK